ncbi:MAG: hypothetical protein U5K77_01400 [Candidatus Saccharibacteria bacterium]|nr:hypothetical protein [Candidatus Saccharibacteria bacterium]
MENTKTSIIERVKESNNVLVTVSSDPSVDQLASAIGITLALNKLGKHATAVFSGSIPSTIEFLKPEDTIEKNTDSLRDFIIALDKSKADKLRYKVQDTQVKIFITPYHTSISEKDLVFSQGDFNVDAVLALGVHEQKDLDQAIVSHGRILHDATVITINTKDAGQLGSVDWVDQNASSLSEMLTDIIMNLKKDVIDAQMATALLTGIVAETDRFSNDKTSSATMNISAQLMNAGANQQLVASKLQKSEPKPESTDTKTNTDTYDKSEQTKPATDGSLSIAHDKEPKEQPVQNIHIDEEGTLKHHDEPAGTTEQTAQETQQSESKPTKPTEQSNRFANEPPSRGGTLTGSTQHEDKEQTVDPLSLPPVDAPILSHDNNKPQSSGDKAESPAPETDKQSIHKNGVNPASSTDTPAKKATDQKSDNTPKLNSPQEPKQTLEEIEQSVHSPHVKNNAPHDSPSTQDASSSEAPPATPDLDSARQAVEAATSAAPEGPVATPKEDIGATGELNLSHEKQSPDNKPQKQEYFDVSSIDESTGLPNSSQQPNANSQGSTPSPQKPQVNDPTAPPAVPPPMMPPSFGQSKNQPNHNQDKPNTQFDAPL